MIKHRSAIWEDDICICFSKQDLIFTNIKNKFETLSNRSVNFGKSKND